MPTIDVDSWGRAAAALDIARDRTSPVLRGKWVLDVLSARRRSVASGGSFARDSAKPIQEIASLSTRQRIEHIARILGARMPQQHRSAGLRSKTSTPLARGGRRQRSRH